jgi:hypothetical protein
MSLSICLVTRNEEANLDRLFRSIAGLADEVIVADTGSTDRTVPIAESHGAKVVPFAWRDDFAGARNFALEQATGNWILWLNPDEEWLAPGFPQARTLLDRADVLAYGVRVRDMAHAERPEHFSETLQLRLFPRRPDLRFVGRLHPDFATPVRDLAEREGKQVALAEIVLCRHAYLSVLTEAKLRWALHLLEMELLDRPGRLPYLIEYGRTLLRLNDPKGHEVLADAVDQLLPLRDAPAPPAIAEIGPLLEYLLTVPPAQSQCRLTADDARELALRWFPQSPPLLWRIAEDAFQRGDLGRAAVLLERLVQCGRTGSYDRSTGFDPSLIGEVALLNLGACRLRLGNLDGAAQCLRPLLSSKTHGARARQYLDTVENLQRKAVETKPAEGERASPASS